jgi:hypothetical protein
MPNIGYGYTHEVSEAEFLRYIAQRTEDYNHSVPSWVRLTGGFPDIGRGFWSGVEHTFEFLHSLRDQIEDEELRRSFELFIEQIEKVYNVEIQAVHYVAQFFGLPVPETKQERRRLHKKAEKYFFGKQWSTSWVHEPGYQTLVKTVGQALEEMSGLKEQIVRHVDHLLDSLPSEPQQSPSAAIEDDSGNKHDLPLHMQRLVRPHGWEPPKDFQSLPAEAHEDMEFGDQRAKDLIDEAEGEFEPREAIKLLHRALRYGKTGIQAGKAYQGLGTRYEELGQIARAIRYYTQALEVGGPNSFVLFWRGQLLYQRRQWAEAKADFEQALVLGLWSPEREEAEAYLGNLCHLG